MILEVINEYECKHAIEADFVEVYNVLEPLVCDMTVQKNIYDTTKRKLSKYLRYAIKTEQCLVVTKNGNVVSAYAGDKDTIVYFGTKGVDLISTVLLMNMVLNKLHNRYKEDTFYVTNEQQRRAWLKSIVTIDKNGKGTVPVSTKEKIEILYNRIKEDQ
jgi:hypothetical protein